MITREISEDQLVRITKAIVEAVKPIFEALLDRIEQIDPPRLTGKIRMILKTAAELYETKLSTLQLKCIRGEIPGAAKMGKYWYVTKEGMDQAFTVGPLPRHRRRR